mgnify:FL=1|tara:strand:- start:225 stop:668 length:444 start_codon:yes stop_codon:yes gene_type:complete
MTDATKPLDISKAYVPEEERVLDPTLIETSIIDRLPQPTGWRVLILPFKPSRRSKGGILLNTKTLEEDAIQTNVGLVLRLGPDAYDDKRFPNGAWCEEKQWVIFARYAGSRFRLNDEDAARFGSEVRILNDDEILATILDPDDLHHN